jgi:predicted dehydrogenase
VTTAGPGGAVRWGILGAAGIARRSFLPALREAGGGQAALVGGRDPARAARWAADQGVERAVAGYDAVVDAPDIDAVYVALPNSLHAEWTSRALLAGKAVLCEKPLCADGAETQAVLATAASSGSWLWEAFVFPFGAQHHRLLELVGDGAIGEVGELQSTFHFTLADPGDIRMSAALGGGALADVGCYPVQLAHEIFSTAVPPRVVGVTTLEGSDEAGFVDTAASGVVTYDDGRLLISCGFRLDKVTDAVLLGTAGRIHLTNPFHPGPSDTLTVIRPDRPPAVERPTIDRHSFTPALRHIHRVLRHGEPPRHLAVDTSLPTARVLDALRVAGQA